MRIVGLSGGTVEVNFDQQVMVTLLDKGLLALIVVLATYGLNSLLEQQRAKAGLEQALASDRAAAYGQLWSKTDRLAVSKQAPLSFDARTAIFEELTAWYYDEHGALYLSHAATSQFLSARRQLKDRNIDDKTLRDSFSTLRTQLKADCGIYTRREAEVEVDKAKVGGIMVAR
jgi:hypothetical protein